MTDEHPSDIVENAQQVVAWTPANGERRRIVFADGEDGHTHRVEQVKAHGTDWRTVGGERVSDVSITTDEFDRDATPAEATLAAFDDAQQSL